MNNAPLTVLATALLIFLAQAEIIQTSATSCELANSTTMTSPAACEEAAQVLGADFRTLISNVTHPPGCQEWIDGDVFFNTRASSQVPCSTTYTCICGTTGSERNPFVLDSPGNFTDGSAVADNYANSQDKWWRITVPPRSQILATVARFDLEKGFDFVRVFEGGNSTHGVPLAEFTGPMPAGGFQPILAATGTELWIQLLTDKAASATGFQIDWQEMVLDKLPAPKCSLQGLLFSGDGSSAYPGIAEVVQNGRAVSVSDSLLQQDVLFQESVRLVCEKGFSFLDDVVLRRGDIAVATGGFFTNAVLANRTVGGGNPAFSGNSVSLHCTSGGNSEYYPQPSGQGCLTLICPVEWLPLGATVDGSRASVSCASRESGVNGTVFQCENDGLWRRISSDCQDQVPRTTVSLLSAQTRPIELFTPQFGRSVPPSISILHVDNCTQQFLWATDETASGIIVGKRSDHTWVHQCRPWVDMDGDVQWRNELHTWSRWDQIQFGPPFTRSRNWMQLGIQFEAIELFTAAPSITFSLDDACPANRATPGSLVVDALAMETHTQVMNFSVLADGVVLEWRLQGAQIPHAHFDVAIPDGATNVSLAVRLVDTQAEIIKDLHAPASYIAGDFINPIIFCHHECTNFGAWSPWSTPSVEALNATHATHRRTRQRVGDSHADCLALTQNQTNIVASLPQAATFLSAGGDIKSLNLAHRDAAIVFGAAKEVSIQLQQDQPVDGESELVIDAESVRLSGSVQTAQLHVAGIDIVELIHQLSLEAIELHSVIEELKLHQTASAQP